MNLEGFQGGVPLNTETAAVNPRVGRKVKGITRHRRVAWRYCRDGF